MDTYYIKDKAYGLREKAEAAAKQLANKALSAKELLKLQYEISTLKAKVIKLEVSLKKDFENAGRAIYAQCEAADEISEDYADQVLALFAEIDAKRETIADLREEIAVLEFAMNPVFDDEEFEIEAEEDAEEDEEESEEIPLVEKMEDAAEELKEAFEEIVADKED